MTKVYDLAPPRNWQDFEDLCLDLFRDLYSAQAALKHGRQGQQQAGVDVFGLLPDGTTWFGVQCKKKLGTEVTGDELRDEVAKARQFNPALGRFVLATTARCDASIQETARELTVGSPFEVVVYDWDHFCVDLSARTELLRQHYPGQVAEDPADLRSHYLRHLIDELDILQFTKAGTRDSRRDIALSKVYVDLDVTATVTVTKNKSDSDEDLSRAPGHTSFIKADPAIDGAIVTRALRRGRGNSFTIPCTALEAAAVAPRRVLVGRGGSGKSTFGRYLCLCLAGEILSHESLNLRHLNGSWADEAPSLWPWPHGALVPFFVELRRFVRSKQFPEEADAGHARHLVDYLTASSLDDHEMGNMTRGALDSGALVVLDGLDETPAANEVRGRLHQVISSFVDVYPGCRVLVTSRPYAYNHGMDWRLDDAGFVAETLAPFDDTKIQRFIQHAYAAFAARHQLYDDEQTALAADLMRQTRDQSSLQQLAQQPLMLTMMTDLHASRGGRLPGARSTLFEASVCLLFDQWNQRRNLSSVADLVGMNEQQIRGALELLAYRTHRDSGVGSDQAADIPEMDLAKALLDVRERYGDREPFEYEAIRDHLNQRSGILIAESPSVYRFPHRFFQEYLAACYLDHFPERLKPLLDETPSHWREVILLLAGRLTTGNGIWKLLFELLPLAPAEGLGSDAPHIERAIYAALVVHEFRLWERNEPDHLAKLDNVRDWLQPIIELGISQMPDRVRVGQVLGLLGDRRQGIGKRDDHLPDIAWVEIPAGSFIMGGAQSRWEGPVSERYVNAFKISRYPLTNLQYELFVKDHGYTDRWRRSWTEEGWTWRQRMDFRSPAPSKGTPFDLANHPRVGVSWYEAVAFCNWLAENTGVPYRLATEEEWERAARGVDGREYPWGPDFIPACCNSAESGIGTTTAVGLFPCGESPAGTNGVGMSDASGNIWEWTSTKDRETYLEPADEDVRGSSARAVRGGSFTDGARSARCAFRFRFMAPDFRGNVGFRLVAPSE